MSLSHRRLTLIVAMFCAGAFLVGVSTIMGIGPFRASAVAQVDPTPINIETVASGLEHPWGMAFLPDGNMLVTERPGRIRLVSKKGRLSAPIEGVPKVDADGQGGMLDVALSPDFANDRLIYISFSQPRNRGRNSTSVARGTLDLTTTPPRLRNTQIIFRQNPAYRSSLHFGSRLVFDRTGNLFITTGDRYRPRDQAQNPSNHLGKIIRVAPDGTIPTDNPKKARWAPEVWSIGHRNVQGAALNPETGALWTIEHGARGGDEINTPAAGKNYGWPVITYGRDYSGASIGIGTHKPGMEQPLHYWDPSIAPSGAAFYTGSKFKSWKGNLFVGALRGRHLARLVLDGKKVVAEHRLMSDVDARIRDVRDGPDGAIWVLTDDSEGALLRITPR